MKKNRANLTEEPIIPVILKMAGGMLFGFAAMSIFNAVDTFFVGQLGAIELAAMSFTFPVIMVIISISMGLGIGISSVVSRSIGAGDHHKVQRFATDGLALAFTIVVGFCISGLFTIEPLFTLLGARGQTLGFIKDYMSIWYIGMPFVVIPMCGNHVIRATGDTVTPSIIMVVSVVVNIVLDPLLIFGMGPIPKMGIAGAALATIIARFISLFFSLSILIFREKLISLEIPKWSEVLDSWRQIIYVGIPAALIQVITPLSLGIITHLLSQYGEKVVAGFGCAGRIEMIILIVPWSLAIVMAPFTGQNWGAKKVPRIIEALKFSSLLSISWGIVIFILSIFFAEPILRLFNKDPIVVHTGAIYLQIVSLSYGFLGILAISTQSFNSLNKPISSAGINIIKAFVIYIPLAYLGAHFWNEAGIFTAAFITNLSGGIIGFSLLLLFLKKHTKLT